MRDIDRIAGLILQGGDLCEDLDRIADLILQQASQFTLYSTPIEAVEALLTKEDFKGSITEPCSGKGAIARYLEQRNCKVLASDIRADGYGTGGIDALSLRSAHNVITNPPFQGAMVIAEHLLKITTGKVALLLPGSELGTIPRRPFFRRNLPARVYLFRRKLVFEDHNGEPFSPQYEPAWYVWDRSYHEPNKFTVELLP